MSKPHLHMDHGLWIPVQATPNTCPDVRRRNTLALRWTRKRNMVKWLLGRLVELGHK